MASVMRLTGTFLDEITHDIPSQNWGPSEWREEFELYKRIGIDTVVIIRAGYKEKCIFPARSIPGVLPVNDDLGRLFFDLADELGLSVYFGTYDSGRHWIRGSYWREIDLNKAFLDEVVERYGDHKSFRGWYLCHETSRHDMHIVKLFTAIGGYAKSLKDLPVLISPYPQGSKQFGPNDTFTLKESLEHWDRILCESSGAVDICAFQDGQLQYFELQQFHQGVASLGSKHGVQIWANIESFDRDTPMKFPPADWRYLRFKLETASEWAQKLITFEFPHFMSPQSCYPSARNLFQRYCSHFGITP